MAKEKKNLTEYQRIREEHGLTREAACCLLKTISIDRLQRIEYRKTVPTPDEIIDMATKYKSPALYNYYCSNECPIGKRCIPEIPTKDIAQIALELLAALKRASDKKDDFVEIISDGSIEFSEIKKFVEIQNELEQIAGTVSALQLWCQEMLASGHIDQTVYQDCKNKSGKK